MIMELPFYVVLQALLWAALGIVSPITGFVGGKTQNIEDQAFGIFLSVGFNALGLVVAYKAGLLDGAR